LQKGSDLNSVRISGQLFADVHLRYTPKGKAIVSFKLDVSSPGSEGKNKNYIKTLIPVVAYGEVVENVKEYLKKDTGLMIEGKLQSRSFITVEGEKKNVLEVVADKITKI